MQGSKFESYTLPSFCSIEAYFYFFLFHLIELLFGHALASVCKAELSYV